MMERDTIERSQLVKEIDYLRDQLHETIIAINDMKEVCECTDDFNDLDLVTAFERLGIKLQLAVSVGCP